MKILDALEAALGAAAPGPWISIVDVLSTERSTVITQDEDVVVEAFCSDARLIALLRNHAADLIAVARLVKRLREWDIIAGPGTPEGEFTADAPYWRNEIDAVLAPLTTEGSE